LKFFNFGKDAKLKIKMFIAKVHVNRSNNVYKKLFRFCLIKAKQKSHKTGGKNNFRISTRFSPSPSALSS
jgi:hypothetical protein